MKALRNHKEGLTIDDMPTPTPGPKDVLIKVYTAALTAHELEWPETIARENPTPCHDVAGTVEAVGAEVTGFVKGDEVFGLTSFTREGAAAEYMVASSAELALKPSSLSFEEAAAISLSALTAWQAIFQHADAKAGQKVLITGAGGGTGNMVVQIASQARLLVSATCSSEKHDLVKSLGATEVFDYKKTAMQDLSHDFDVVIDCVGEQTLKQCFDLLKGDGTLVSLSGPLTEELKALRPDIHALFFIVEPDGDELTQIAKLCEQEAVRPILQAVMPLEKGAEAFAMLGEGHSKGKIVLKVV